MLRNTVLVVPNYSPIKSTSEGISKYVGKYIGKHMESRLDEDKGARLVEYSRGARGVKIANTRFYVFI